MPRSRVSIAALVFFVLVGGSACRAAAQESRKVLYSLEPGETLLRAESVIALTVDAADIVLVTAKGKSGPFFVVRDGGKKGPFAKLDEAMEAAYAGREDTGGGGSRDCAAYSPDSPPDVEMSMDVVAGGQVLHFKEATIGPHAMIAGHKVSQDGARVFVTAADADTFWFKCTDGRKVSFGGTPGEILISPDGKNAAVEVQGSLGMRQMQDLSKLPPDKLAAALKDMEKKFVYTIDGKKHGPFDDIDQVWYARTSNDLYFEVNGQFFRNGTAVAGLKSVNRCDFYPSPDGRSYAIAGYEAMKFSDGKEYPAPLDLVVFQEQGKTVFKWITLEKEREIVVYQRPM